MEVCYQLPVLPLDRPVPQHVLSRRGAISFSSSSALFGCPNPRQLSQVSTATGPAGSRFPEAAGSAPAPRPAGPPPGRAAPLRSRRAAAGRQGLPSAAAGGWRVGEVWWGWAGGGAAPESVRIAAQGRASGLRLPPRPSRRSRLPRLLPNTGGGDEKIQRFIGLWPVIVEVIFLVLVVMRAVNSLRFISRAVE